MASISNSLWLVVCYEAGVFAFDQATNLVASGKARIADDEPEREALEAAVRAYRAPRKSGPWELALAQPRYFDLCPRKVQQENAVVRTLGIAPREPLAARRRIWQRCIDALPRGWWGNGLPLRAFGSGRSPTTRALGTMACCSTSGDNSAMPKSMEYGTCRICHMFAMRREGAHRAGSAAIFH